MTLGNRVYSWDVVWFLLLPPLQCPVLHWNWSEYSPIALHCPLYAASSRGVLLVMSLASTLAPWLRSSCIQSTLLWKAATCRGVRPRWSLKFTTNGPKCLISSSKHCSLPWKLKEWQYQIQRKSWFAMKLSFHTLLLSLHSLYFITHTIYPSRTAIKFKVHLYYQEIWWPSKAQQFLYIPPALKLKTLHDAQTVFIS